MCAPRGEVLSAPRCIDRFRTGVRPMSEGGVYLRAGPVVTAELVVPTLVDDPHADPITASSVTTRGQIGP